MKKDKSGHDGLMAYAGRHRYLTYAAVALSGVSALLALVPFIMIWMIVRVALGVGEGDMALYGWLAVAFAAASVLVYVGGLLCSHLSAFRVASNIRKKTLAHIVKLPPMAFDMLGSGRARKIIDESSAATETYLAHNLPDMAGSVVTPVAMIAMLFVFDWRLGLASLLPVALAFLTMMRMTGKSMQDKMKQYADALENMNNEAVEYIRGVPVVKTFGQTVYSFSRFKTSIDDYHKWVVSYTKELRMPMMIYTLLLDAVFVFLIGAAFIVAGAGAMDSEFVVDFIFYVIFTPLISVMLTRIMFSSENGMIVRDAMSRINGILDMQPLPEPAVARLPQDSSVRLENVTFRYPGAATDALHGVDIYAAAGEHIALVGPSGGGKSTAASLICRFCDVGGGRVLVGGEDVRDIGTAALTENVAFVSQQNRLLKCSIADNVRLSRPSATDDEVRAALHAAMCDEIVAKLPDGADTVVGRGGVYLSGGEMQRVCVARALLKDAPVIVLDEATAFADPENEEKMLAALSELCRGKTVVTIAHRLSSVTDCDRIYVLDGGRVSASGTHAELLGSSALYARMWEDYNTSVSWHVGGSREAEA